MQKRLCMFDLDGTLMNTLSSIAGYMNRALTENGFAPHAEEKYKYFAGNGAKKLTERALAAQNALTEENFAKVFACYNQLYDAAPNAGSAPYEGIPELLSALAERGVLTAVLSNKPDFATHAVVRAFFPAHTFSAVHGGREGVPLKPAPEGAWEILKELGGISPEEVLYVGDTNVDMELGARASFETVGVLWGFRTEEELRLAGADHIISLPEELLSYLV